MMLISSVFIPVFSMNGKMSLPGFVSIAKSYPRMKASMARISINESARRVPVAWSLMGCFTVSILNSP